MDEERQICLFAWFCALFQSKEKIYKVQATKRNYRHGPWEESSPIYFSLHVSVRLLEWLSKIILEQYRRKKTKPEGATSLLWQ